MTHLPLMIVFVVLASMPPTRTPAQELWFYIFSNLLAMLWVIAMIAMIALVVSAWRKLNQAFKAAREAQQRAKDAHQSFLDQARSTESALAEVTQKTTVAAAMICKRDFDPISAAFQRTLDRFDSASTTVGSAIANPDTETVDWFRLRNGFPHEAYEHITQAYEDLCNELSDLREEASAVDRQLDELVELARNSKAELSATEREIVRHQVRIMAVEKTDIWVADAKATLSSAITIFVNAGMAAEVKAFRKMATLLSRARLLAGEAAEMAEYLQRDRARLITDHLALQGALLIAEEKLDQAANAFAAFTSDHERALWSNVIGNGSSAEQALTNARNALDAAQIAFDFRSQNWSLASKKLETADGEIERAKNLAQTILNLKRDLCAIGVAEPKKVVQASHNLEGSTHGAPAESQQRRSVGMGTKKREAQHTPSCNKKTKRAGVSEFW